MLRARAGIRDVTVGDTRARPPMRASLGIWAFGSMVTRFVPGGYQPERAGESTVARVRRAVDRLGGLIDGYEFRTTRTSSARTTWTRCATRSTARASTTPATGLHLDARFGKGGLVSPDPATRAEAVRRTLEAVDFSGRDRGASGPGSRATTPSRRRTRSRGSGSWTGSDGPPIAPARTGSSSSWSTRTRSRR